MAYTPYNDTFRYAIIYVPPPLADMCLNVYNKCAFLLRIFS